ncbi:MAG: hypothetical protein KIT17_23515 [Rubrivivax sp.]|nr:hypothetical protein [Rubrivivax sp.]
MSREFEALPQAVRLALQQGRLVDAVRLLRQASGISLKAAHARVKTVVDQGVPASARASGPVLPPPTPGQQGGGAAFGLVVTRLLQALRAAERRRRGESPEQVAAAQSAEPGALAPGEQPQAGGLAGWLTAALVVLLVALVVRRFG